MVERFRASSLTLSACFPNPGDTSTDMEKFQKWNMREEHRARDINAYILYIKHRSLYNGFKHVYVRYVDARGQTPFNPAS